MSTSTVHVSRHQSTGFGFLKVVDAISERHLDAHDLISILMSRPVLSICCSPVLRCVTGGLGLGTRLPYSS